MADEEKWKGRRERGGAEGKAAAWEVDDGGEGEAESTERLSLSFDTECTAANKTKDVKTGRSELEQEVMIPVCRSKYEKLSTGIVYMNPRSE